MPDTSSKTKLESVHSGLLQELENIRQNLPDNVEDISEAFERYARVVALMVRSLESLLRLERQTHQDQSERDTRQTRRDIVAEIERRLARIAEARRKTGVSDDAE